MTAGLLEGCYFEPMLAVSPFKTDRGETCIGEVRYELIGRIDMHTLDDFLPLLSRGVILVGLIDYQNLPPGFSTLRT